MTTHLLKTGRALCGFPGIPGEWPKGHDWLPWTTIRKHAVCAECVAARERICSHKFVDSNRCLKCGWSPK